MEPRRSAANEKREKSVWRPSLAGERRRKEEGGGKKEVGKGQQVCSSLPAGLICRAKVEVMKIEK